MGWERMVYTFGIAILVAGVCMAVLVGPAFMPMIFPDADATTTVTKYAGVTSNPINPLHFRNDQYGNVHITSADFFVPRFLHCAAPASGYDAYIASGIIMGDGRMYNSPTWYSTDVSTWPFEFTHLSKVNPQNMFHGGEIMAVIKPESIPSPGGGGYSYFGVYYLHNETSKGDFRPASQFNRDYFQAGFSRTANDVYMVDLDEEILKTRGYLLMTNAHSFRGSWVAYTHDPVDYFLYSTLPGGSGGWQTFEYKPAILYTGGTGATVTTKAGNLALGYNILAQNSEVSVIARAQGDFIRETMDGSFTALNVHTPGHYQQIEPYWYPDAAGSSINSLTIPYYKLYDDPDNDSTSYALTCQIINPWGAEDLFTQAHVHPPDDPCSIPAMLSPPGSWTGGVKFPVNQDCA